jgi:hypothetical protein
MFWNRAQQIDEDFAIWAALNDLAPYHACLERWHLPDKWLKFLPAYEYYVVYADCLGLTKKQEVIGWGNTEGEARTMALKLLLNISL